MYKTIRTTLILVFCFFISMRSNAEGSKELAANGGNRAFWRCSGTSTAQFPYPNPGVIRVYANVGERIYLGSSAQGINGGTISWVAPNGATGSSGNSATVGFIPDRAAELLGPRLTTDGADPGYNPYIVTVGAGQAGVWEITFTSTSTTLSGITPLIPADGPWTQNPNSVYLAAFDVSVRNSANTAFLPGRAYLNIFSGNTASVGTNFGSFNGIFYILTRDGYQYSVDANGMQGVAFQFFVNNKGVRDASGNSAYSSVVIGTNPSPATLPIHNPTSPDDATNVTHKLFFNPISTDLPLSAPMAGGGATWLLSTPVNPTLSALTFTGAEGTANATGTSPLGGTFTFNSSVVGAYRLSIDVNQNGIFTDVQDVMLTGFSVIGANSVPWDVMDGEGNPVPGGTTFTPGSIKVEMFSGEVHFPLMDVERNPNGIIVTRLNGPGVPDNILYWDDTVIPVVGTPSNPVRNLAGQPSNTNGHIWNLNFGDNNGMDSWSYISSTPLLNTVPLEVREADLEVVSITPENLNPCVGSAVSYTVLVRNNGPRSVTGARFTMTFPAEINAGLDVNVSQAGGASWSNELLSPGDYSAIMNMPGGSTVTFVLSGTVGTIPAGGNLTVNANILRTADITDPNATDPDANPPVNAAAECDAAPSGVGCNNVKTLSNPVSAAITLNNIGADQSLCVNATPQPLTGTAPGGGNGTFTYLWEMSTTSATDGFAAAPGVNNTINYTPGPVTGDTWFRRIVISGCRSESNVVTITTSPPSTTATVTPPTCTVATGSIVAPDAPGLTFSLNGGAYQSSGTFPNLAPGNYTLTVQNTDGCVSSPMSLTVPAQPATPAAPVVSITDPTCTVATGTITVTTIAGLEYSINGTDYQATGTFANVAPGNYNVIARNADGCISTATAALIAAQPATPAAPTISVTDPTCTVATGAITVTTVAGLEYSINGTDYQPTGTFVNVAPGNYNVTARNADGCVSSATAAVIAAQPATPAAPIVSVTDPTCTVATGTITVTTIAGLEYSINGTDYQPTGTFANVAPGNYNVTARNADGCISTATAAVVPAQPALPAAPTVSDINYCQGDAATALQAGGTQIKWYSSETGGQPLPAAPVPNTASPGTITYWASQTNAGGCESARSALTVTVFAKPVIQITSSTAAMNVTDARRALTAIPAGGTFSGNGVITENGNVFFNPAIAGAGSHTLTYTFNSGGNCTVNATFVILVNAVQVDVSISKVSDAQAVRPNDVFRYTITATNNSAIAAPNVVVTDAMPSTLNYQSHTVTTGTATHSSANNTLTWNIASLAPGASQTLVITVNATSTGSISNSANIVSGLADSSPDNNAVTDVKEIVELKVPNIFTPNGDGRNDRFVIKGLELYQQNQLIIINRWGNHVFEQKNYNNTWEGTGLLEGTYYYLLKLTDRLGKETVLKGFVTIMRAGN